MLDEQTINTLQSFPVLRGLEDFELEVPPARPGHSSRDRAAEFIDRLNGNLQAGSRLLAEFERENSGKARQLYELLDRLDASDRKNALIILEDSIVEQEKKHSDVFRSVRKQDKLRNSLMKKTDRLFGEEFGDVFRKIFKEQAGLARLLCEEMTERLAVYRAVAAKLDQDAHGGKTFSDHNELERYLKNL